MRTLTIVGIIGLVLFLGGCAAYNSEPQEEYLLPDSTDYYAFDIDVVIGEEDISPDRNKVPADEEFSIKVTVSNIGTAPLPMMQSRVFITRITNPAIFGLGSLKELERRLSHDLEPGEEIIVEFANLSIDEELMGESGGKLEANFCYTTPGSRNENCYVKREIFSLK